MTYCRGGVVPVIVPDINTVIGTIDLNVETKDLLQALMERTHIDLPSPSTQKAREFLRNKRWMR